MNIKTVLLIMSSFAAGIATGVFGSKKHYQNKYQKQYEEDHAALEEYYQRVDEYERSEHDEEDAEENEVNPTETDSKPGGRMTPEERKAVKKELNKQHEPTNYFGMYRERNGYTERQLAEGEHPLDNTEGAVRCDLCRHYDYPDEICRISEESMLPDDSCSDFETDIEASPEADAFDEHQKNKDKPPKIISAEAYAELPPHIDKKVLYLYAYDEIVVDEDNEDEPLDEERLIGDALTKYGFIDNEERLIFVMNYAQDTCYEVQKVDAAWTDTH